MILITLGTQDKPFNRLLDAVQKQIDNGKIKEDIIVQAGYTKYSSNAMQVFDLIPISDFEELMSKCDLLITHGGVGSIIAGLKLNKKVIAAARLAKFGEHINDHQTQIIENFAQEGYILALNDFEQLDTVLDQAKTFIPKKFESNTKNMISLVEKEIMKY